MYKIEANIPIPPPVSGRRRMKYPFDAMQTGDSFFVSKNETKGDIKKLQNQVGAAAAGARKKFGFKFAMRTLSDGLRIWRIQ